MEFESQLYQKLKKRIWSLLVTKILF